MTPPPRFDGVNENGLRFLVLFDLKDVERSKLPIRQWMKTVWACFEGQAFDWINSHKEIRAILQKALPDEDDKKAFKKLICEQYPVGKKSVVSCEQYVATKPVVTKPVVKKSVAAKVIHMQQGQDETIREYYERFNNLFVQAGSKDDVNKYDLGYEELLLLFEITENWIQGLNNRKLRRKVCSRYLYSNSLQAQSLFCAYTAAERQQKEAQVALQQQLQEFVDRGLVDDVSIAQSQKSYESPPVLEEMPCDLPEISTAIVDTDTEATDEVLASGPGKWIAAAAGKEVFDSTVTLHAPSKNPPAPEIVKDIEAMEASDNSFGWSRCCTVDDVEVLNQEVFALAALYDAFLKNPPAEDMEISVVVDMPSLKYLMDMDGPTTEAFDSGTTMGAPSKTPSIQHIEDPETMEKVSDSACTYELPALPAFDLSIAIDFEAYTVDTSVIQPPVIPPRRKLQLSPFRGLTLRNTSFGWSRSCTNPIGSRTSSVSTCTSVSDVTSVSTVTSTECVTTTASGTNFCEGEQSFCSLVDTNSTTVDCPSVSASVECVVSEDTDFYGGEQSSCSTNAVCTFVVVASTHAALTLTVGMVMKPARISLLGPSEHLAPKPKHKGLPKVKIKDY